MKHQDYGPKPEARTAGPRYLGLDLGTSSVKALILDEARTVVASARESYTVSAPVTGWAESRPTEWWGAVTTAVASLPDSERDQVAAVGVTGQMHGVVLTDADREAVRPAIIWSDTRSTAELYAYRRLALSMRRRLANPLVTGMAGPTLLWLKRNDPGAIEKSEWALQPKDWLRLRLTGNSATDPSDASATLLYDLEADTWADDVVQELGLPSRLLPEIRASHATAGELTRQSAVELGLRAGIPVITGCGDTPSAAYGSDVIHHGDAQLTIGTGAQLVVVSDEVHHASEPRIHLFRSAIPAQFYVMAAMQNAGLALNWVRDILNMSWAELYFSLEPPQLDPQLVFHPYLTGERTPLLNPNASGAWVGLRPNHTRKALAAAAVAGVVLAILDGFRTLQEVGIHPRELRLAGGGSTNPVLAQLICDVLETPIARVSIPDVSAKGASLLAMNAVTGVDPQLRPRVPLQISHEPRPLSDNLQALVTRFDEVKQMLY